MKSYIYLLSTTFLIFSFAFAEENDAVCICKQNYHRIYVGPDLFWERLKSNSSGEMVKLSLNTLYGGIRSGYDYLKPEAFYLGTEGLFAIGRTYTKTRLVSWFDTGRHNDFFTPLIANLEQRFGYTFQSPITCKFTLTPFIGIGWYYLKPQFDDNHSSSNWVYSAFGFRGDQLFYENFEVGFRIKAMYIFAGQIRMWFINKTIKITIKNTWGYEVGIPFTWHIGCTRKWDIQLHPYLLKFNIDDTGLILGARILFGYNF